MPNILSQRELVAELQRQAVKAGLTVRTDPPNDLNGEAENIRAKWWLGGRKVAYRMSCHLTEADHTVHFREAVLERSWGLPPPTFTIQTTTLKGWKRSGERHDVSLGGGGTLDYGKVRERLEAASVAAGWHFDLEGGRLP